MVDNVATAVEPIPAAVKRYAPPNQRNRSHNRRKSGEKNQLAASRNVYASEPGGSHLNENPHQGLVFLEGCSNSPASQLLNDRWEAAMNCYNDASIDSSEKPVMYSSSTTSAWGQFRLPHQVMSPPSGSGPSSGLQLDFLAELQRAKANAGFKN